jgi:hypothetical protein
MGFKWDLKLTTVELTKSLEILEALTEVGIRKRIYY